MCVVAVGKRSHAMRAPILFQGIVSVVWWKPEKQKKEHNNNNNNNKGKKNRWFGFWVIEQNVRIDSLRSRVRNPNLFVAVVAIGPAWMYACVFNANGYPSFSPLSTCFVHCRYPWVLRIVSTIALSRQKIAEETKCGWVAMHHNFVCCTDTHRTRGFTSPNYLRSFRKKNIEDFGCAFSSLQLVCIGDPLLQTNSIRRFITIQMDLQQKQSGLNIVCQISIPLQVLRRWVLSQTNRTLQACLCIFFLVDVGNAIVQWTPTYMDRNLLGSRWWLKLHVNNTIPWFSWKERETWLLQHLRMIAKAASHLHLDPVSPLLLGMWLRNQQLCRLFYNCLLKKLHRWLILHLICAHHWWMAATGHGCCSWWWWWWYGTFCKLYIMQVSDKAFFTDMHYIMCSLECATQETRAL